jgi:Domain of unknown function (DUF5666)
MKTKKIVFLTSGLAMLAVLLVAAPTLAATVKNSPVGRGIAGRMGNFKSFLPHTKGATFVRPAAFGKISVINGNILTITGNNNTTYAVDATNAKITQGFGTGATTLTIGNLTVGEMVSATGTVNGTNIAATAISVMNGNAGSRLGNRSIGQGTAGKISAISGSILTVTGNNNTAYSVDATNAKITQGFGTGATALTVANLTVGEMIFASGTVSGTNVTATAITVMNNAGGMGRPGNFNHGPRVSGNVTAVNGSSFTVQRSSRKPGTNTAQNISYTVNTAASTVFTKNGKSATLADVTTGEIVAISGTIDSTTNTVSASSVNIIVRQARPLKKTGTSLIGKFLNIFKKKK